MKFDQIMSGFRVPVEKRVPRDLFNRAPWNRWSFQHIREILPLGSALFARVIERELDSSTS